MIKCFFLLILIPLFLFASEAIPPSYSTLKHREHKGIGYDMGYSSLDVMINPIDYPQFYPFLNARGHVFNDGRFATNIGLVGRFISKEETWILGGNIFYDFRSDKHLSPVQLGAGFELFFGAISLRFNGYRPFASVKSKNHKPQVALAMLQGEMEKKFIDAKNLVLSGSIGAYYLPGRSFKNRIFGKAWGSQAKLTVAIYEWIEAGLETTYDQIFNFTLQAYVGIKIPFNQTKLSIPKESLTRSLFKPIRRSEIIPIQS